MMFLPNRVRVLVSTQPVDFRKGHDGLAALVSSVLRKDPFTGTVFVFRSRRADRLKLLYWDGTGLVMALNHAQFEALFAGLDWRKVKALEAMPTCCARVNQPLSFACICCGSIRISGHDCDTCH